MVPPRVLSVLPFFTIGGTENVAITLAKHLRNHGGQVTFCVLHRADSSALKKLSASGFEILNWSHYSIEQKIRLLQDTSREHNLLHAHLPYTDGVLGVFLESPPALPVVITAHLPDMRLAPYQHVGEIVACCEYAKKTLSPPPHVRTSAILNGSDSFLTPLAVTRESARSNLGLPRHGPIFGRLSRLDEEKFSTAAYESWKRWLTKHPDATAVIVGDGEVRGQLLDNIARDGLKGRMILPGATSDPQVWLAAFDVFMYSTDVDACPMAIVEAMGAGLPIIAPSFNGIPELLCHNVTGLLYPHNDWDCMLAFADKLVEAPAMAASLGRAARERYLGSLTGRAMFLQYENVYSRLMGLPSEVPVCAEPALDCTTKLKVLFARVGDGRLEKGQIHEHGQFAQVLEASAPIRIVLQATQAGTVRVRVALQHIGGQNRTICCATVLDGRRNIWHKLGYFTENVNPEVDICLTEGQIFTLNVECSTAIGARLRWVFEDTKIEFETPSTAFHIAQQELLELAKAIKPGGSDSHDFFVLTCANRIEMAIRNVASHLLCAWRKPKRVVVVSFDDLSAMKESLPSWCEYISGDEAISRALLSRGLSPRAMEKIRRENMFAKYAIPRLLLGPRVLVSDDDVFWAGPANEMLCTDRTFFFMEDLPGFYGRKSIRYFADRAMLQTGYREPPFLCAGLYYMNGGPVTNPSVISDIIDVAESHRDEQSAVGMETRMDGVSYEIGRYPFYHHGAYGPHPIPERFNAMHLQGYLMTLRDHPGFQLQFIDTALASHSRQGLRARADGMRGQYAVFIPLHPSQIELLELNLTRAKEIGALNGAAEIVIIEDAPKESLRKPDVKELCQRFGVRHDYADETIGVFSLQQTRQVIRHIHAIFEANQNIDYVIRCDVDILLEGDAWRFLSNRADASGLDICADIRPDFRYDSRGYIIIPCSLFSRRASESIFKVMNDEATWKLVAPVLVGVDDVDISMIARLLGLLVDSPDGRMGYHTIFDISSVDDFFKAKATEGMRPRAFHFRGNSIEDKLSNMRYVAGEISARSQGMNGRLNFWRRIGHKVAACHRELDIDVSILVCCRNYLRRFRIFAQSIMRQDWPLPRIEVIVANPDSPDGLREYLHHLKRECLEKFGCGVFIEQPVNVGHGRNRGYMIQRAFERSHGRVVFGMDCDLVLPVTFVREVFIQTVLNPDRVVGVYRNFLSPRTTERILSGEIDAAGEFQQLTHEDESEENGYRGVLGYCQSVDRSVWQMLGYPEEYDEIAKSDVAFVERTKWLGMRPLFLEKVRVLHLHHPRNWSGTEDKL